MYVARLEQYRGGDRFRHLVTTWLGTEEVQTEIAELSQFSTANGIGERGLANEPVPGIECSNRLQWDGGGSAPIPVEVHGYEAVSEMAQTN